MTSMHIWKFKMYYVAPLLDECFFFKILFYYTIISISLFNSRTILGLFHVKCRINNKFKTLNWFIYDIFIILNTFSFHTQSSIIFLQRLYSCVINVAVYMIIYYLNNNYHSLFNKKTDKKQKFTCRRCWI